MGALGAIIRDSRGIFIAATVSYKQHALDVPSMEASSILLGLRLAQNLGIHDLKLESDSMHGDSECNPLPVGVQSLGGSDHR